MTHLSRNRIRLVFGGILVIACLLVVALYKIQIIQGDTYSGRAGQQYSRPQAAQFDRGKVYFESKDGTRIAAATIGRGSIVYMNPKQIVDPENTYNALKEIVDIDKEVFMKATENKKESYRELLRKVDDQKVESIKHLSLPGINTIKESWRSYPGEGLSSHVLGLVGQTISTSTIRGTYGLELQYQDILDRSSSGSSSSLFLELFSGVRDVFGGGDKEGELVTTIEPTVQGYLEKIISDTGKTWQSDEIGGIILDPKTGDIVAMALLPTFNGNDTRGIRDASVFSNRLVEHAYEMGSIMKPLTVAVGLDSGKIDMSFTYDDTGTMEVDDRTIGNWDRKARGITSLQDLLSQSLNVGAATVGLKVGGDQLYKYFGDFGLNGKTGIDLPHEASSLLGNLKEGQDIDIATASYGQGIAFSPISIARALAVLSNGGYVVTPRIVKSIEYTNGSEKILQPKIEGPVLKKQTVVDVTSMLVNVVDETLKKGAIKMDRYSIAAKTGTAQIPDPKNGGYYTDRYLHSFFGYFPAYSPQYLVFLYQIYPKGANYASETLTDPFANLTKFLINYYDVPPDR